jgi:hypothetical protein
LGFNKPEGLVRLRGQVNHEHKVQHTFKKHTRQLQNTIKNTRGKQQTIAQITQGTSSTNDAYQLAIFGVSPIHPRGMLVVVIDSFIFWFLALAEILMTVVGEAAVVLNCRCRVGKCRFAGLFVSHHMGVRPSEGSLKFSICGNVS